ncbi:MAG: tetratricopeptide repeat protein [Woeseia sp.]
MWLLHSIKRHGLPLLLALLLSACASMPGGNRVAAPDGEAATVPAAALTLYEQAVAAMAAGEDVEAQLRFSEFLLRYPDYPGAHVNMAILQARAGDDEQAEASLERALQLNPQHAAALNQRGMLLRRQGRFEEAAAAYLAAASADPSYALPHYNLGVLNELYLQRLADALLHFQKYQALGGDDAEVEKWIVDLERRIAASQRTANVTE